MSTMANLRGTPDVRGMATVTALRRAFALAPGLRRGLAGTLVLAVLGAVGGIVVPITLQVVIDRQILAPQGVDLGAVIRLGMGALVVLLATAAANRAAQVRMSRAAADGLCELQVGTFAHLHRLSILQVED